MARPALSEAPNRATQEPRESKGTPEQIRARTIEFFPGIDIKAPAIHKVGPGTVHVYNSSELGEGYELEAITASAWVNNIVTAKIINYTGKARPYYQLDMPGYRSNRSISHKTVDHYLRGESHGQIVEVLLEEWSDREPRITITGPDADRDPTYLLQLVGVIPFTKSSQENPEGVKV